MAKAATAGKGGEPVGGKKQTLKLVFIGNAG
jgi:hypothetical protein